MLCYAGVIDERIPRIAGTPSAAHERREAISIDISQAPHNIDKFLC